MALASAHDVPRPDVLRRAAARSPHGSVPPAPRRTSPAPAARRATSRPEPPPTAVSASTAGTWAPSRAARTRTSTARSASRSSSCQGPCKLFDGKDWVDSHPGDFAYVPEGGLHGFRNESGEPASLLILFAPGAPREAYFEGLVELAEGRWKPSHEELQAFFEEHDNIYV